MREEKTFRVVVFRFETDASTNYTRYMITKNYMPFFPGNQWLELKSIGSCIRIFALVNDVWNLDFVFGRWQMGRARTDAAFIIV